MNIYEKKFQQWQEPDANIYKIFHSNVSENPDELALVDGDKLFTYLELDELVNRLAGYLQANGVKKDHLVGLYLEKCYEYMVSCLAILKIGGAYLHLDLDYAEEPLKKILEEASPVAIISKSRHCSKLPASKINKILVDKKADWNSYGCKLNNKNLISSDDIAFVGYSSGTTGIPKGIKVSHKAAIYALSKFWQEVWHFPNINRFGYTTYLSWDAMSPLMFGAAAHIIPDDINYNSLSLVNYIMNHKINHTFLTPSLFKNIIQEVPEKILKKALLGLDVIWVGGEVMTRGLLEKIFDILPKIHLFNNYGPSECFVVAQGPLTKDDIKTDSTTCPVGKILPEMDVLFLNNKMQQIAPGASGELYVAGPCLADGYLNNPKLTKDKFIRLYGKTYFKTNDLGHIMPDGRLIIEGRIDFIANINGNSINLLELQDNIKSLLPVADCAVIYTEDKDKNQHLFCFLVKRPEMSYGIDPIRIKNILAKVLPEYMIPEKYFELKKIPVDLASQKFSYKQLNKLIN